MRNSIKHKNAFEKIKKNSKKFYSQYKLGKFQMDIKKTWTIMKEIVGKTKAKENVFQEV